jgi:hypothetical protein
VSYANFAQPFSSWMSLGMEAIGIDQVDEFRKDDSELLLSWVDALMVDAQY